MENTVPVFRYRWFIENCSLLELPNGKVIVIDPIFRKDEAACANQREKNYICGFDDSVVERCDYILLTHIHFDHTGSLKALYERFRAPILVNGWSAFEMVKFLDMPVGSVIPMSDGCEYNFDDFRVLWQQGRHTAFMGTLTLSENNLTADMPMDEKIFFHKGTTYHSNFILKLPNGMSVAMDGGWCEPHLNELEKYRPTLILHHAQRNIDACYAAVSQQLRRSGSPMLFLMTMQILEDPRAAVEDLNRRLAADGISGRVVFAEPGQWITFAVGAVGE